MKLYYYNPNFFIEVNSDNYFGSTFDTLDFMKMHSPGIIEGVAKDIWFERSFLHKSHNAPIANGLSVFMVPSNNSLMVRLAYNESVPYDKSFSVKAEFFDIQGNLLASETKISGQNGELPDKVSFYTYQLFPDYHGKYRVHVDISDPETQKLIKTVDQEYYIPYEGGLSGVIRGANAGILKVRGHDFEKIIQINEGYFKLDELRDYFGELQLDLELPSEQVVSKKVLKIVPDYTTILDVIP